LTSRFFIWPRFSFHVFNCSLLQFHMSFCFLLTSRESCDLETATAIFTYITHYTTQAIMHAHFVSVKTNLNYWMSSIYDASVQRAAKTKTKHHIEVENDMLEWIAVGHFWWWKRLRFCN
jgi:hypothetical protein